MFSKYTALPTGPLPTACGDVLSGVGPDAVLVRLFYPSDHLPKDRSLWTPWDLGPKYSDGLAEWKPCRLFPNIAMRTLTKLCCKGIRVPAAWCGQLAKGDKFPVVIFSHGLCSNRSQFSGFCSNLASHGFVVGAVEHKDGSASATFYFEKDENGNLSKRWIPYIKKKSARDIRKNQLHTRVVDCNETLKFFDAINNGTARNCLQNGLPLSDFSGRLDMDKSILCGHSFGGATCLAVLSENHRFKLGICLDPWLFPVRDYFKIVLESVLVPVFCLSNEYFETTSRIQDLQILSKIFTKCLTIKGAIHECQADLPSLIHGSEIFLYDSWSHSKILNCRNISWELCTAFLYQYLIQTAKISESMKLSNAKLNECVKKLSEYLFDKSQSPL